MPEILARLATPDDNGPVSELRQMARVAVEPTRGGREQLKWGSGDAPFVPEAAPTEESTVVGTIDGVVVGYCRVVRRASLAIAEELFTLPGARRVGVGHELVEAALAQASRWGCAGLDSYALPGDRDTKNFFEGHGMKSRLLTVHRTVGQ